MLGPLRHTGWSARRTRSSPGRRASPRSSSRHGPIWSARRCSPAWSRTAETSWFSRSSAAARTSRTRPSWPSVTRFCFAAPGEHSTRCRKTPTCSSTFTGARPPASGPTRAGRVGGDRRARRDGRPARDGRRPTCRSRAAGRRRVDPSPRADGGACVSGDPWTTVVLVAGMLPLSTAIEESGAAKKLADGLVDVVGGAGPYALLVGLVLLVFVLGQLISNMATALIVIPISISAAAEPRCLRETSADGGRRRGSGVVPHARRDPANLMVVEAGRLRVRRLLEARAPAPRLVLRRRGLPRPVDLALLRVLRSVHAASRTLSSSSSL